MQNKLGMEKELLVIVINQIVVNQESMHLSFTLWILNKLKRVWLPSRLARPHKVVSPPKALTFQTVLKTKSSTNGIPRSKSCTNYSKVNLHLSFRISLALYTDLQLQGSGCYVKLYWLWKSKKYHKMPHSMHGIV